MGWGVEVWLRLGVHSGNGLLVQWSEKRGKSGTGRLTQKETYMASPASLYEPIGVGVFCRLASQPTGSVNNKTQSFENLPLCRVVQYDMRHSSWPQLDKVGGEDRSYH